MSTKVVRIESDAASEAAAAARLLGVTQGDLLATAWREYRESEQFKRTFEAAQKAMSSGDLAHVVKELESSAYARAAARAARAAAATD